MKSFTDDSPLSLFRLVTPVVSVSWGCAVTKSFICPSAYRTLSTRRINLWYLHCGHLTRSVVSLTIIVGLHGDTD